MSVKVLKHGAKRRTQNPVTRQWNTTINVQFVELDRGGGANAQLSESSQALSAATGVEVGLPQMRTHTQPVLESAIGEFPVGKEFPSLFINRALFSMPQMEQQENAAPRMVDGKPTYFTTSISQSQKEDEDNRLTNSDLVQVNAESFQTARTRNTVVETLDNGDQLNAPDLKKAGISAKGGKQLVNQEEKP